MFSSVSIDGRYVWYLVGLTQRINLIRKAIRSLNKRLEMYLLCFAILLSIGWKGGEKQYWVAAAVRRYPTNESPHVPCSFLQSVNVTDDQKLDNGSYIHDGILIPSNWIGTYNYVFTRTMTRLKVKPHSRGCICSVKACINICCPMNSMYSNDSMECSNLAANSQLTFKLNVTLGNVSLSELRISEHFILLNVQPCKEMYLLKPEDYPSDSWQLLEVGVSSSLNLYIYLCFYRTVHFGVNMTMRCWVLISTALYPKLIGKQ